MNHIRERILLLLLGGIAFGYSFTPGRQRMVLETISKEWKKIDNKELREGIKYLYKLEYIDKEQSKNGFVKIFLTEKGKMKALNDKLKNIRNKKEKWDGKWRMVAFDVPERYKAGRDALRRKLKSVGFCELQKSVLVTPYNCRNEIEMLVNFFKLNKYVRFGILEYVDNKNQLESLFNVGS